MNKYKSIKPGDKCGWLVVVKRHKQDYISNKGTRQPYWVCRCEFKTDGKICGETKVILDQSLRYKITKTCGKHANSFIKLEKKCILCREIFACNNGGIKICDDCKKPKKCACSPECTKMTNGYNPKRSTNISIYAPGHHPNQKRNIYKLECKVCGDDFIGWHKNHTRCETCRKPKGEQTLKCEECGDKFESLQMYRKFCDECIKPRKCQCSPDCKEMTQSYGGNGKLSRFAPRHSHRTHEIRKILSKNSKLYWKNMSKDKRDEFITNLVRYSKSTVQTTPEKILETVLDKRYFRYYGTEKARDHGFPISVDFASKKLKLIIQVDGCHWHECPQHGNGRFPRKREHDRNLTRKAQAEGWTVLRFWEHDIKNNIAKVLNKIAVTQRSNQI